MFCVLNVFFVLNLGGEIKTAESDTYTFGIKGVTKYEVTVQTMDKIINSHFLDQKTFKGSIDLA